ncbi:MAG TPA: hypothetical protein VKB62_07650 [Streptosporangiaceae bacterium]|nr:hypothetical protein [Streptosporangiaceae bacterium]
MTPVNDASRPTAVSGNTTELRSTEPPGRTVPAYGSPSPADPAQQEAPSTGEQRRPDQVKPGRDSPQSSESLAFAQPDTLPKRIRSQPSPEAQLAASESSAAAFATAASPGQGPAVPPDTEAAVPARTSSAATPSAVRPPAASGRRRNRTALVAAATFVGLALVAAAVVVFHSLPPAAGAHRTTTVFERHEAESRQHAAAWVSQQVSPSAVVACDAAMCQALRERGFPAANLRLLQNSSSYPFSSDVVIETATVRSIFGSSLGAHVAPEVITTIGSAGAVIEIRVIAQHGVAAYERALAADLSVRKHTGAALLGGPQITTQPVARQQLAEGSVDTRLLYAITVLAASEPINIVNFGSVATRPSAGLPLRYADLAGRNKAAHQSPTAYVHSLVKLLSSIKAPFGPIRGQLVQLAPGRDVLRLEVSAPSPLGLLGPGGH